MSGASANFQLFSLGTGLTGTPHPVPPASFKAMGALEVQDIERWLKARPEVLGEDLLIISSQFSGFENTKDRPDLLALDRIGKLVVVEIKRDDSGAAQDLQALRYAAYLSTAKADDVIACTSPTGSASTKRS